MPATFRKKHGKEERQKAGADTRRPVFVFWAKDDTAMYRAYTSMIVSKNDVVWIGLASPETAEAMARERWEAVRVSTI
jgi:hypothetical protein